MKFSNLPIKNKLTIFIMASTLLSVVVLSSLFTFQRYSSFKQQMSEELSTITKIIADQSTAAVLFEDADTLTETLSSLSLHHSVLLGCTYSTSGDLLAEYSRNPNQQNCTKQAMEGEDAHAFSGQYFHVSEKILIDGEFSGLVHTLTSTEKLDEVIKTTLFSALTLAIIIIAAALLFARYIQRFISDPLIQLQTIAHKVTTEHDFSLRATKHNEDEVGELVDAFNTMLSTIYEQNQTIKEHSESLEQKVDERTAELEIANQELESFSYSVSHDLKAPLRIIDGFSRALEEDYGNQLDDTAKDYLTRVRVGSFKMNQLITNLLQLAKVTRQEINKVPINLSRICIDISNTLCDEAPERQAHFNIQNDMEATGDIVLIEIVLDNLLGNAWKYCSKKRDTEIEVGSTLHQGNAIYFVRDNGTGFDMKYAQKLFKPFNRLHSTEDFEGTGIGLATVARIIERHHGKIWVESSPNLGTTFFFTLFPASSNTATTLVINSKKEA